MGNVSGREDKGNECDNLDYFMECARGQEQVNSNSSSSYPAHISHQALDAPSQSPNQIMQIQREEFNETSPQYRSVNQEKSKLAVINWIHGGTHVAIEGSWDNWRTRELLEGSGSNFSIVKVLNVGVYHYRFVVDGHSTYAPDLPHEYDNLGNEFNILDLKDNYAENLERDKETECPTSPISSYNNALFTLDDFSEKYPEMPPLLQQMPLNQASSSKNHQWAFQKPLLSNLNHLYVKRDGNNQPVVALSSSQRFRSKFVTSVLYKPFKKARK